MVIKNKITVRAKSPIAQMVSLSAIGSSNAALNRRMNTAASVLINGAANTDSSTITVATPNAFLTISVQPTRVSIVSENIPPTTGTKLSTAYFAARIVNGCACYPLQRHCAQKHRKTDPQQPADCSAKQLNHACQVRLVRQMIDRRNRTGTHHQSQNDLSCERNHTAGCCGNHWMQKCR